MLITMVLGVVIGYQSNEARNIEPVEHLLTEKCVEIGSTLELYDSDTIFCENKASFEYDRKEMLKNE